MSRIYEALQKAESERKSERREPEFGIPDQPASAAMTTAVADPEDAVFSTPRFAEASLVTELSVAELPALLERGPAVEQFRSLRSRIFELRYICPVKTLQVHSCATRHSTS